MFQWSSVETPIWFQSVKKQRANRYLLSFQNQNRKPDAIYQYVVYVYFLFPLLGFPICTKKEQIGEKIHTLNFSFCLFRNRVKSMMWRFNSQNISSVNFFLFMSRSKKNSVSLMNFHFGLIGAKMNSTFWSYSFCLIVKISNWPHLFKHAWNVNLTKYSHFAFCLFLKEKINCE